jgi:hypothetical protein
LLQCAASCFLAASSIGHWINPYVSSTFLRPMKSCKEMVTSSYDRTVLSDWEGDTCTCLMYSTGIRAKLPSEPYIDK